METLPCLQTNLQAIMAGRQEVGGGITSDIEVTDLTSDFLFLPNNSEALALIQFVFYLNGKIKGEVQP